MTGNKTYLTNYVEFSGGVATFGSGSKGKVPGKGTLNVKGLPSLKNVLYVKGLTANLISLSQMCDDNFFVQCFSSF